MTERKKSQTKNNLVKRMQEKGDNSLKKDKCQTKNSITKRKEEKLLLLLKLSAQTLVYYV